MRAIMAQRAGGPDVLEETELDRPEPGPVEILVRVHAAGVNPTDWKARARGGTLGGPGPFVPGYDVSGVVEAVGPGVRMYAPGDEVFGMPLFPKPPGAYAEYVVAPPRHFARKPARLDHVTAAGLPLAGLTAWQSLVDFANLGKGQRVLIHAAAGGVGHLAVQVAKARGAHVVGTASAAKHDFLKDLGADEVIDYTREDWVRSGATWDVIFDAVGKLRFLRVRRALAPGGAYLPTDGFSNFFLALPTKWIGDRKVRLSIPPRYRKEHVLLVKQLLEEGRYTPVIDRTYPLEDVVEATRYVETGQKTGNVVLTVAK